MVRWGNLIQGNLTSGNDRTGVNIGDEGSNFNTVIGNKVGTDVTGTKPLPNEGGIAAGYFGSSFNRIGGTAPGEGNLISGNLNQVYASGPGSEGALILGNRIGTSISGSGTVGRPAWKGISVGSAVHTMIGGASSAEGNLLTNAGTCVNINGDFNFVIGNRITLERYDEQILSGVYTDGEHNWIQGNVMSGTLGEGVRVEAWRGEHHQTEHHLRVPQPGHRLPAVATAG